MAEIMDIMDAFSTPLKLAWVLWLAWAVGQIFWYRRERVLIAGTPALAATHMLPAAKPAVSARRAIRHPKSTEILDLRTPAQPPVAETPVDTSEFERAMRGLDRQLDVSLADDEPWQRSARGAAPDAQTSFGHDATH